MLMIYFLFITSMTAKSLTSQATVPLYPSGAHKPLPSFSFCQFGRRVSYQSTIKIKNLHQEDIHLKNKTYIFMEKY